MNYERKSKLNIGAGLIFLLLALFTGLVLLFNFLIPGYPVNFAFVVSLIQLITYIALAVAFFAGKRSHVFTVLFSLMVVLEIINFVYTMIVYSDYGYNTGSLVLAIVVFLFGIIAYIFAAIISASAANNRTDNMTSMMKAWAVPGAILLVI